MNKTFSNNVLGNPVFDGDSAGRNYRFAYYDDKQLPQVVQDPLRRDITKYIYDPLNRLSKNINQISYRDGAIKNAETTYTYDDNDNLKYIFDADGNKTEYVYDSRDRLKAVIYPGVEGSVQYTYNKNDQVATYTDLNGTIVTNTYDPDAG